ncbi:hypothetical protein ACIU1J_32150 [Azospirillum doebereinerae]|uniref:hypothetical protein n=1 Tax=Azospirillum doebereinerae TaxID=92933 RepID=UPI001EE5A5FE|nr:hypothetical protein [Azospirillum doebereinerae]MCG5243960.1 hypothetical protein [Azospirillum doebereinerae]
MDGTGAEERWVGVRAFTRALSAQLGREVAASTITRAVQGGRIPSRAGAQGPEIPLAAGIVAYRRNTDPTKAMGPAVRDGQIYDLAGVGAPVAPVMPSRSEPASGPAEPSVNRIKTAQAAIQLQSSQLDLAERQGQLVAVEPMRAAFGRQIAGMIGQIEVSLPDLGQRLAEQFALDAHELQIELRLWFRALRAAMAKTARAQGEALPDLAVPADDAPEADDGEDAAVAEAAA